MDVRGKFMNFFDVVNGGYGSGLCPPVLYDFCNPHIGLRVVSISGLHQDAHREYVSTTEASKLGVGGFRPLMDTTLRSMRFFEDVVAKKMACLSTETV